MTAPRRLPVIIKPLTKGLLTFIPGTQHLLPKGKTGGTDSATYCYGVWMKHLTMLREHGMDTIPETVAELGPGDSLGIGLAAMLSGANRYYALDVVPFTNTESNLEVFDELVALFKARTGRPSVGWPDYDRYLDPHLFPSHILTDEILAATLADDRVSRIRRALINPGMAVDEVSVEYHVPWSDDSVIQHESVDLILSHSVLEHVADLEGTYHALKRWLKPDGMMSHQIDFGAHGLSREWNGFRGYSELLWKLVLGKRTYLINRVPCSVHLDLLASRFKIVCEMKRIRNDGISRSELSPYWRDMSDEDLNCSGVFVQAVKS